MLRIDIYDSNHNYVIRNLDVGYDENFEATFQENLHGDLSSREASFSSTITVPKSQNNVSLLHNYRHNEIMCDVYIDDALLFSRGFISIESEDIKSYSLSVYSEKIQSFKKLGDMYIVGEKSYEDENGILQDGLLQNHPNWDKIWTPISALPNYFSVQDELSVEDKGNLTLIGVQTDHFPSMERISYNVAKDIHEEFNDDGLIYFLYGIYGDGVYANINEIKKSLEMYRQPMVQGLDGRSYRVGEHSEEFAFFPAKNFFPHKNLYPAVKHSAILIDALSEAGYKLKGDILTDEYYNKLYIAKAEIEPSVCFQNHIINEKTDSPKWSNQAIMANWKIDKAIGSDVESRYTYVTFVDCLPSSMSGIDMIQIPINYSDYEEIDEYRTRPSHLNAFKLPKRFRGKVEIRAKIDYKGAEVEGSCRNIPVSLSIVSNQSHIHDWRINDTHQWADGTRKLDIKTVTGNGDSTSKVADLALTDTDKEQIFNLSFDISDHLHKETWYTVGITSHEVFEGRKLSAVLDLMRIGDLEIRITPKDFSAISESVGDMDFSVKPDSFIPQKTLSELLMEACKITNTTIDVDDVNKIITSKRADRVGEAIINGEIKDYSDKFIVGSEKISYNPKGSHGGNVARNNRFKWKNENNQEFDTWKTNYPTGFGNNVPRDMWEYVAKINDNTLDYSTNVIELPYSASNTSKDIPEIFDFRSAGSDRALLLGDSFTKKVALGSGFSFDAKIPTLRSADWDTITKRNYVSWIGAVENCEYVEVDAVMSIYDVINFDFSVPIYVGHLNGYYLVDRISYNVNKSNVSMMRVRPTSYQKPTFEIKYDTAIEPQKVDFGSIWNGNTTRPSQIIKFTNNGNVINTYNASLHMPVHFNLSPSQFTLNEGQSQNVTISHTELTESGAIGESVTFENGGDDLRIGLFATPYDVDVTIEPSLLVEYSDTQTVRWHIFIAEPMEVDLDLTVYDSINTTPRIVTITAGDTWVNDDVQYTKTSGYTVTYTITPQSYVNTVNSPFTADINALAPTQQLEFTWTPKYPYGGWNHLMQPSIEVVVTDMGQEDYYDFYWRMDGTVVTEPFRVTGVGTYAVPATRDLIKYVGDTYGLKTYFGLAYAIGGNYGYTYYGQYHIEKISLPQYQSSYEWKWDDYVPY